MGKRIALSILAMLAFEDNSGISDSHASAINLYTAKYSQTRESHADRKALEPLHGHFGHVGGATELFEGLQSGKTKFDLGFTHYFESHPELQQRIDDLQTLSQVRGNPTNETQALVKL